MCLKPKEIYDKNTGEYIKASCRKCIECMQTRANEWALRGHFELKQHKQNCFITLTYASNPIRLYKEDMQNFIKRLRKKIAPKKIKYFSCGEYGDQKLRPHFHIIIFGHDFQDKKFLRMSKSDLPIYESKELDSLWPNGLAITQEANVNTIRYSARYSTKLKKDLPQYLKLYPEFNTMSQNLGIEPILKNIETYIKTDQIYIDGFAYKIPDIILKKYALQKTSGNYHERDLFIENYKAEIRNYKFRSQTELKIAERLANKKKQYQKLREL